MSNVLRVPAAILAFGTAGCALAAGLPPSVEVTDVRLLGVGLTEQQLALTLCVTNPNRHALAFRRVTADLDVSGAPLATGTSILPVRLPAASSTVVPLSVLTTTRNLGPQLLEILRTGSVTYQLHGIVALEGGFGITVPYSRGGHLDPVAGSLGLASATSDITSSRCASTPPVPPGN